MLAGEGYGFPADARNAKKKCQLSEWELLTSRQLVHRPSPSYLCKAVPIQCILL